MAYLIEFDGPVNISGKDGNNTILLAIGVGPELQLRAAFLGTMVEVETSGNISIQIRSDAALDKTFTGGPAGREDAAILVSGNFIVQRGPNDPDNVTVRSNSNATLAATTNRTVAGLASIQAEARLDVRFDQLTDSKRRREDINLNTGTKQRFDVDFANPTGGLTAGQSYPFSVTLVLEASKVRAPGTGDGTARFGASPGLAEVSLTPVQPKKRYRKHH